MRNMYRYQFTINNNLYKGSFRHTSEEASIDLDNFKKENSHFFIKIKQYNTKGDTILLSNKNEEIIIDDNKWEELSKYNFSVNRGYVYIYTNCSKRLHRYLFNINDSNVPVDHINNNKLDNRLCNLRIVSYSQNSQNKPKKLNTSSIYIGVFKTNKKINSTWRCSICKNGEKIYPGIFTSEIEAAIAYNIKAREIHGNFGTKVNLFPPELLNDESVPQDVRDKLKIELELQEKYKDFKTSF